MSEADPTATIAASAVTARRVQPGARPADDFTYSIVMIEAPARTSSVRTSSAKASSARPGPAKAPSEAPLKAPVAQANDERRADGRVRTRLRDATLAEGRGRVLMDCRIRDKSRQGARLQLDEDRPLPKVFLLSEPATGTCYRATLVWQAGRDAGVRLVAGK